MEGTNWVRWPHHSVQGRAVFHDRLWFCKTMERKCLFKRENKKSTCLKKSQMVTLQALNFPCYYCVALTFLQSQSPQQELLPP